jgi:hypothetical protein
MKVKFAELFKGPGKGKIDYSDRAAALAGSHIEIRGWVVALQDGTGGYALVDRPDDAADSAPAIRLPGFRAVARYDAPVQLRGRLSYGFAVAQDGFASFLRLEEARIAGASARLVPTA